MAVPPPTASGISPKLPTADLYLPAVPFQTTSNVQVIHEELMYGLVKWILLEIYYGVICGVDRAKIMPTIQ